MIRQLETEAMRPQWVAGARYAVIEQRLILVGRETKGSCLWLAKRKRLELPYIQWDLWLPIASPTLLSSPPPPDNSLKAASHSLIYYSFFLQAFLGRSLF